MRDSKPLTLRLKSWEAKQILEAPVEGGHLGLRDRLIAKLVHVSEESLWEIELSDAEVGEIWRHMAYGGGVGGWQHRLRQAFLPAFRRATGAV
jgi:hypothetical protein